jgi:hypothetical protein
LTCSIVRIHFYFFWHMSKYNRCQGLPVAAAAVKEIILPVTIIPLKIMSKNPHSQREYHGCGVREVPHIDAVLPATLL